MPDATEPVRGSATYGVGDGPVYLSVTVGRKQHGSVLVVRPALPPYSGGTDLTGLNLGDGPALIGQRVRVYTTVTYIDPQASQGSLVVDYTLSGGGANPDCDQQAPVPDVGSAVSFVLDLSFKPRGTQALV